MWTRIWQSDGRLKSKNRTVFINQNKDKLYLVATGRYLVKIDLNTNKYEINYDFRDYFEEPSSMKFIQCNNKYHLIGCSKYYD